MKERESARHRVFSHLLSSHPPGFGEKEVCHGMAFVGVSAFCTRPYQRVSKRIRSRESITHDDSRVGREL